MGLTMTTLLRKGLRKINETEMFQVIDKLREKHFPDLPSDLVMEVLRAEIKFYEDEEQKQIIAEISRIVEQCLSTEGES